MESAKLGDPRSFKMKMQHPYENASRFCPINVITNGFPITYLYIFSQMFPWRLPYSYLKVDKYDLAL